ncbi:hypothetical protein [Jidongwangia harbinensis]|uniref:hypothetical protein n=1 Tax=Jidongwangia harbinensis TaxID=2878561 RepID=UPI001CDA3F9A|nr:hypothetical protein [Jidongwangia harbinensis]MCA2211463.1 hypothetical protein [Jidongwangia harbinensis]
MTATDPQAASLSTPAGPARPAVVRWADTVLGAAFAAEDTTSDLVTGLRRAAARHRRRVAGLADRGAAERARWRQRAERTADDAVVTVATSPVLDRVVDHQLERILRPVVRAVLDDVLLLLEKEPERIQALIRGQRESMVDELVGRLRAGADAGDTAVEGLAVRVFRRGPRRTPAPPPEL